MTKKKKIILISVAITLALVMTVGGLVYARILHMDVGGNKLIGTGEMGMDIIESCETPIRQFQSWDTQFIITNPNCARDLNIEWVALIASDENVIAEGTPDDWDSYIDIPDELSPHEVWQVSIAQLYAAVYHLPSGTCVRENEDLDKYTLEVTWSGVYYNWWRGWRRGHPLVGWQKEKCWNWFEFDGQPLFQTTLNMSISEAEMKLFPSLTRFHKGEPYFPDQG